MQAPVFSFIFSLINILWDFFLKLLLLYFLYNRGLQLGDGFIVKEGHGYSLYPNSDDKHNLSFRQKQFKMHPHFRK